MRWIVPALCFTPLLVTSVAGAADGPVVLDVSDPDTTVTVARKGAVVAECRGGCSVPLEAGRYTVSTSETAASQAGSSEVELSPYTTVDVEPAQKGAATVPALVAAAGIVAVLVGGALVLQSTDFASIGGDSPGKEDPNETTAAIGGALLLSGLVATPIGFIALANSSGPDVTQRADATTSSSRARASAPSGFMLSIGGTF
ncbi:MAG: hypothetical protein R3B13_15570 [Polyangiaceae bacterium]